MIRIRRSILASFSGGPITQAATTRAKLQELTERYVAAMNRHDAKALAALYAPVCTIESPLFATIRGRAAVEESYRQWFSIFPDVKFTIEAMLIDPPSVSVMMRVTATHEGELLGLPPTHRRVEFVATQFVKCDNLRVTEERRIYDFTGLLVKLGVLRAKPAKP